MTYLCSMLFSCSYSCAMMYLCSMLCSSGNDVLVLYAVQLFLQLWDIVG